MKNIFYIVMLSVALCGCSLAPTYTRPDMPVSNEWPDDVATRASGADGAEETAWPYEVATRVDGADGVEETAWPDDTTMVKDGAEAVAPAAQPLPDIGWKHFFTEAALQKLITLGLENNRDLRTTVLNIERARGMYQIQRADLVPAIGINGASDNAGVPASLSQTGKWTATHQQGLTVGFSTYELDFFGRVRSLKDAALEEFLSTEEAHRAARISLVSQIAVAYVAVLSDQEHLALAVETFKSQQASYVMIEQRYKAGTSSELDLRQAQTSVETARVDIAKYEGQVAMDFTALSLLVGTRVTRDMLPPVTLAAMPRRLALPVGLPSQVLLQRPDILQAEHLLKGANANIGAARANFFPRISLTANVGQGSDALYNLFAGGSGAWAFMPSVRLPIFEGGKNRASLRVAEVDKEIAVNSYEKAIQTAFREVVDALIRKDSVARQCAAQQALVDATAAVYNISTARYAQGVDSYLTVLDSQRALYNAQMALVIVQADKELSSIELYRALGYGWKE